MDVDEGKYASSSATTASGICNRRGWYLLVVLVHAYLFYLGMIIVDEDEEGDRCSESIEVKNKGLVNLSVEVSKNTQKQRSTAMRLFEKFVVFLGRSMDDLSTKDINFELLGLFGDYMFKYATRLTKAAPAMSYMSDVKGELETLFKTSVFSSNPLRYSRLRHQLEQKFVRRLEAEKKPLTKKASGVGEEALFFASEVLFDGVVVSNLKRRFGNRLLLLLARALAGRISEVRNLSFFQFEYSVTMSCFVVRFFGF